MTIPKPLTGSATFADDICPDGCLYLSFARAMEPCGTFTLDTTSVERAIIHTAVDIGHVGKLSVNPVLHIHKDTPYPLLADGQIAAIGQPVAAILADTPQAAAIAADAVVVHVTPLPHKPETIATGSWRTAAIPNTAHVVEACASHARLAPSPIEPRTITVDYQDGSLIIHHATQTPHRTRSELAQMLSLDPAKIRVVARHVGGAFGMKASLYPEEVFAVWAALHHRKPVKWTATRSEDFLSATQGRGVAARGQLSFAPDGTFLALQAEVTAPLGHWLPNSALIPAWNAARILPGGYAIEQIDISTKAVTEPRAPMGIYRGAGRPEAALLMEQLVEEAAKALGRDPLDLRLQNLRKPGPTPTGNILDSGTYSAVLNAMKPVYQASRSWRADRRATGALAGVGVSFYLEPSGAGFESARVTLEADGTAHVASGSSDQGQGREATLRQIASDALKLPLGKITVTFADTATSPEGIGALASRSTAIGGGAVKAACEAALEKGGERPVTAEIRYENEGQAWGFGAYLIALEVDPDTGTLEFNRAHCIDDAGTLVCPALAHGQIRGGFAQGFGEAVMEQIVYDDDHQLLTGSFMDYAMPRARDVPSLSIDTQCTPSPTNILGAKGIGEAGTIGAPPAILAAVQDAIGVRDLQMPLTPFRVWQAMKDAR